jgi:hypothetical protein
MLGLSMSVVVARAASWWAAVAAFRAEVCRYMSGTGLCAGCGARTVGEVWIVRV